MSSEQLIDLFHARTGVICAVGAGGKKTCLYRLVDSHPGRIGLTATVNMSHFPADLDLHTVIDEESRLPERLEKLADSRRLGFGTPSSKPDRYAGLPPAMVSEIHARCGFDATFVKADGARRRWIKAPREGEPVLPPDCTTVITLVSAKVINELLSETIAHRIELLCQVTGAEPGKKLTVEHVARLMTSEDGLLRSTAGRTVVPVINMVDDAESERQGRAAAIMALESTDRFDRVILSSMRRADDPIVAVVER